MEKKDESVIPRGLYCYSWISKGHIKACPYWSSRPDKPKQENGYCSYLGYGDWEGNGLSLLWDMVKECGVNEGDEREWPQDATE